MAKRKRLDDYLDERLGVDTPERKEYRDYRNHEHASEVTMPLSDITSLDQFKKIGAFAPGYPPNVRRYFSPDDDVHGAIMAVLNSCSLSFAGAMYGYDDDEVNSVILKLAQAAEIPCQLCLDKSQAGGVHERKLIAEWPSDLVGNRLVIGQSRKHAISHTKLLLVDGFITIGGSTNLSASGEGLQNNECFILFDPTYAAETRAKIDMTHAEMVAQMGSIVKAPVAIVPAPTLGASTPLS